MIGNGVAGNTALSERAISGSYPDSLAKQIGSTLTAQRAVLKTAMLGETLGGSTPLLPANNGK